MTHQELAFDPALTPKACARIVRASVDNLAEVNALIDSISRAAKRFASGKARRDLRHKGRDAAQIRHLEIEGAKTGYMIHYGEPMPESLHPLAELLADCLIAGRWTQAAYASLEIHECAPCQCLGCFLRRRTNKMVEEAEATPAAEMPVRLKQHGLPKALAAITSNKCYSEGVAASLASAAAFAKTGQDEEAKRSFLDAVRLMQRENEDHRTHN